MVHMKSFFGKKTPTDGRNTKRSLFIAVLFVLFIIILTLNFLTPLFADDFAYSGSKNIIDVLDQEYHQYLSWTGRSVAHILVRVFLMPEKLIFNVANSLVFIGLILLTYLHSRPARKYSLATLIISAALLFEFIPVFGQTVLWLTGACNYLWGTTIILAFLLPYSNALFNETQRAPAGGWLRAAGMFLGGVVAGWCNENTSGGCLVLALVFILLHKKKHKSCEYPLIFGEIGCALGYAFLILAPGNYVRGDTSMYDEGMLNILFRRITQCTETAAESLSFLIVVFICLIVWSMVEKGELLRIVVSLAFALLSLGVIYILVLSPSGRGGRAVFGSVVFMVIAVTSAFEALGNDLKYAKIARFSFTSVLILQAAMNLWFALDSISRTFNEVRTRERYVTAQSQYGNKDILIPGYSKPDNSYNCMYGADAALMNINNFREKYSLDSLKIISHEEWGKVLATGDPALIGCFDADEYVLRLFERDDCVAFIIGLPDGDAVFKSPEELKKTIEWQGMNKYLGVVENKQVIHEHYGEDVYLYDRFDWLLAATTVEPNGIVYKDIDYLLHGFGLNIVVLNTYSETVVDSCYISYEGRVYRTGPK
ncbi:MAG: DUF6056 family protein [Oscillospiraceae bacterium]|nr:DUF6056 family protein [Oscillospiraceae bacterium]